LVSALNKVRNHFGVNRVALAGALASLQDSDYVRQVAAEVERGKDTYRQLAESLGTSVIPSATNFIALDVGDGTRARALVAGLLERGVFVRMPAVAPLDRCIRITVGPPAERPLLVEALRAAWQEI
jgi:histidinol-phosphate aminotransferase